MALHDRLNRLERRMPRAMAWIAARVKVPGAPTHHWSPRPDPALPRLVIPDHDLRGQDRDGVSGAHLFDVDADGL